MGSERAQRRAGRQRPARVDEHARTLPRLLARRCALGAVRRGEGDHRRAHRPPRHSMRLAAGQPSRVHARALHGMDRARGGVLPPAVRLSRIPDAVAGGDARRGRQRLLRRGADGRGRRAPAPLRFVLGMAEAAVRAGARVFESSRVERIRWGSPVRVSTADGVVEAEYVVLAGNAYLGRLEPRIEPRIMPIVNHVLATEPLGERRGPLPHTQRRVRALDPVRRRLLSLHGRPPAPVRWRRDLLRPAARRSAGIRAPVHAAGIPPARGCADRPCVGRAAGDHHEPVAARRAARPERLLRPGILGPWRGPHPDCRKLIAEAVAGTAERFDVLAGLRHRAFPGGRCCAIRCSSSACSITRYATSFERHPHPGPRFPPTPRQRTRPTATRPYARGAFRGNADASSRCRPPGSGSFGEPVAQEPAGADELGRGLRSREPGAQESVDHASRATRHDLVARGGEPPGISNGVVCEGVDLRVVDVGGREAGKVFGFQRRRVRVGGRPPVSEVTAPATVHVGGAKPR